MSTGHSDLFSLGAFTGVVERGKGEFPRTEPISAHKGRPDRRPTVCESVHCVCESARVCVGAWVSECVCVRGALGLRPGMGKEVLLPTVLWRRIYVAFRSHKYTDILGELQRRRCMNEQIVCVCARVWQSHILPLNNIEYWATPHLDHRETTQMHSIQIHSICNFIQLHWTRL